MLHKNKPTSDQLILGTMESPNLSWFFTHQTRGVSMAMLGNTQSVHLFDQQNGLIGNHTLQVPWSMYTCIHFYHHFKQKQNSPISEDYNHCKLVMLPCICFTSVISSHEETPLGMVWYLEITGSSGIHFQICPEVLAGTAIELVASSSTSSASTQRCSSPRERHAMFQRASEFQRMELLTGMLP